MRALTFSTFGPPEVLEYRECPAPVLQPGHAIVAMQSIGLNYADVYRRRGKYHLAGAPPYIAGYEGAGVVADAWEGCPYPVGARVGFADVPFANAEQVLAPFEKLIPLPDAISMETASACLLQGLTAQFLSEDSHRIRRGESVLVHAAAGGVGLLLVQMCVAAGANVIGITSSQIKREQVRSVGAQGLLYDEDWVSLARSLGSTGEGVDVVYDSVGTTLVQSLATARTGGHIVFYGFAGGDPPSIDPRLLMDESKTLTGGDLWNILTSAEIRCRRANTLFEQIRSGGIGIHIADRFPLALGADAHRLLESRSTSGKILLIP